MVGKTGRVAAAAALTLALGLGGCAQDGDTASVVGRRQAAEQPPAAVVPRPSPLPIARERSRSGAQEFGKYWFATLNYAISTGTIDDLRAASITSCAACVTAVTSVRTSYSDGGSLKGGLYTVRSVNIEEFALDDRPVLSMLIDRSARSGIGPDGAVRDSLPAGGFITCELTLEWTSAGWRAGSIAGDLMPRK